jgi:5-methylcytosine-specific restriction endonuclease McrA
MVASISQDEESCRSGAILARRALVLNRNWQPTGVATVARCLIMLWNRSALAVDPIDYQQYDWNDWSRLIPDREAPCIRVVQGRIRVPEVVALVHYDRLRSHGVTFNRRNVFRRDRMTCQYCGRRPGSEELTIDHVIPRSQGGKSTWDNCVLACVQCNSRKAARTPAEAKMRLARQPVRPAWRPTFADRGESIESWAKFISQAYWDVELEP